MLFLSIFLLNSLKISLYLRYIFFVFLYLFNFSFVFHLKIAKQLTTDRVKQMFILTESIWWTWCVSNVWEIFFQSNSASLSFIYKKNLTTVKINQVSLHLFHLLVLNHYNKDGYVKFDHDCTISMQIVMHLYYQAYIYYNHINYQIHTKFLRLLC